MKDLYLNTHELKKMEEFERDIYIKMYQDLISYLLNPFDFRESGQNLSTQGYEKLVLNSPQSQCIQHLVVNLIKKNLLVSERELSIDDLLID